MPRPTRAARPPARARLRRAWRRGPGDARGARGSRRALGSAAAGRGGDASAGGGGRRLQAKGVRGGGVCERWWLGGVPWMGRGPRQRTEAEDRGRVCRGELLGGGEGAGVRRAVDSQGLTVHGAESDVRGVAGERRAVDQLSRRRTRTVLEPFPRRTRPYLDPSPSPRRTRRLSAYEMRGDRKSTRLNSSHITRSRMPSSA